MFSIEGVIEGVYAKPRKDGKGSTCRIGVTTHSLRGGIQNEFGFAFDLVPTLPSGDPHDPTSFATKDGNQFLKVGDNVRVEAYHSDKYGPVFSDSKDGEVSARITVLATAAADAEQKSTD
jgi:hypothetical protein